MFTEDLYEIVLNSPPRSGADTLYVITGYASATFANRHINDLMKTNPNIIVNILIGMRDAPKDHLGYLNLLKQFPSNFICYYYNTPPEIHCKMYAWFTGEQPKIGFSGSANYSSNAFSGSLQKNQMTEDEPLLIRQYFHKLRQDSSLTLDTSPQPVKIPKTGGRDLSNNAIEWITYGEVVQISFLDKQGEMPLKSGLNWGQRKGREPNQAYLSIKGDARKEGFLPEKESTFTLLTDDGKAFDCTVQQDGRKAVTTTRNNSILGKYIRQRIGVDDGAFVSADDLKNYGRTHFTLSKIDDETFTLDLSI